jgi:hypothetical protein
MTSHVGTASHPVDIRRARFSWHFHTPGRRRWLLVQFVSAPRDFIVEDEQDAPAYVPPQSEALSQARLLDDFAGEMWRRRSF